TLTNQGIEDFSRVANIAKADRQLVRGRIASRLRRLVLDIAIFGIEADVARLDVAVVDARALEGLEDALHPAGAVLKRSGRSRRPRDHASGNNRDIGHASDLTCHADVEPRAGDALCDAWRLLSDS